MFISAGFTAVGTPAGLSFLLPEHILWTLGIFSCSTGAKVDIFQAWGRRCFLAHSGDERGRPAVDHEGNSHSAGTWGKQMYQLGSGRQYKRRFSGWLGTSFSLKTLSDGKYFWKFLRWRPKWRWNSAILVNSSGMMSRRSVLQLWIWDKKMLPHGTDKTERTKQWKYLSRENKEIILSDLQRSDGWDAQCWNLVPCHVKGLRRSPWVLLLLNGIYTWPRTVLLSLRFVMGE